MPGAPASKDNARFWDESPGEILTKCQASDLPCAKNLLGALDILHSAVLDNSAVRGHGGTGGQGFQSGLTGSSGGSAKVFGGGIGILGIAYDTPDTRVANNQANVDADVSGMLNAF